MNRLRFLAPLALALCASPAFAQTPAPKRAAPGPALHVQVFGAYDSLSVASSRTWDTVFGTSKMTAPVAGADITGLWKGLFIHGELSSADIVGERVAIISGTTYKLGTTLTVALKPRELGLGWRFANRSRLTPYVGASAVFLGYTETSDFADSLENSDESLTGFGGFAGVDVRVVNRVFVGGEVRYRAVNASPATGSALANFGEKNLGGLGLRVRLGVRF